MEDTFCREFMSGLIAPGGGAKTSLRIVQGLSLATNIPLTGQQIFLRCRVLIIAWKTDGRNSADVSERR